MKKALSIFAILIALSVSLTVSAYDIEENGIYYNILDRTTVEVTYNDISDYQRYTGSIRIPAKINHLGWEFKVVGIGDSAFWGCGQLIDVDISDTDIQYIGKEGFHLCYKLKIISFCDSLQRIDTSAFASAYALENIQFANHTNGLLICCDAFKYCDKLKELDFLGGSSGEVWPLTLESGVFSHCRKLISIDLSNLQNTTLPENLFGYCDSLKSVTLGGRTTEIGDNAFISCRNLSEIKGTENITKIGRAAFSDCESLEYFSVPNCEADIEFATFYNCINLKDFTWKSYTNVQSQAFNGCTSLKSITFPEELTSIESYAFSKCSFDTVICKNETPATIDLVAFEETTEQSAILIVPCRTSGRYSTATGWKNFAHIEEDCSGIEDLEISDVLSVYPNPAENYITVEAEDVVTVINNAGQTVKEINNVKGSATIDITDLKSGVYYVKSGNKTEKLIIK